MTEWRYFKSSKYKAECCYCNKDIPLDEGRWTVKDGNKRFNACTDHLAPPDETHTTPPPLNAKSTIQPTIDGGVVPTTNQGLSREDEIRKAHEENMESAKQTRNCLVLLMKTIDRLAMAIERQGEAKQ